MGRKPGEHGTLATSEHGSFGGDFPSANRAIGTQLDAASVRKEHGGFGRKSASRQRCGRAHGEIRGAESERCAPTREPRAAGQASATRARDLHTAKSKEKITRILNKIEKSFTDFDENNIF